MYPIYAALVSAFDLGMGPCRDLESPINRSEMDVMDGIQNWFKQVDDRLEVWQMRQLLQTSGLATDENLRALIQRHLAFPEKTEKVRDKVDYLLVQYYAHVSPHDSHNTEITLEHVMGVLFPVLGYKETLIIPMRDEVEQCLSELAKCSSLGDLLERGILERIRKQKERAGQNYFNPAVMIVFAHCNFLVRLGFFRLMHADLHGIRYALHELELKNRSTVDCTEAGLSAEEPLESLRDLCHAWKDPFRKAYSSGTSFKQLIAIRRAVEDLLAVPDVIEEPKPIESDLVPEVSPIESAPAVEATPISEELVVTKNSIEVTVAETQKVVAPEAVPEVATVSTKKITASGEPPKKPTEEIPAPTPTPTPGKPALTTSRQTVAIDISKLPHLRQLQQPAPKRSTQPNAQVVNVPAPLPPPPLPIQQVAPAQHAASSPPARPVTNFDLSMPQSPQPTMQRKKTQIIDVVGLKKSTDPKQTAGRVTPTPENDVAPLPLASNMSHAMMNPEPPKESTSELDSCLKMIFNKIRSATAPGMTVMIVDIGGTRLTLASWEVMAFARGIDDTAATLRRCVGVRALLCVMMDRIKSGQNADLKTTLTLCHAEASLVQEKVAKAKDNNSIDAAVNLAATAKRLLATLEEAEKLALQLK